MIPSTVLISSGAFDGLGAQRVGSAIARGVGACGWQTDVCAILSGGGPPEDMRALLDALDFDARMRRARAVVLAVPRLEERTLAGSVALEIATRARQAGVPAYAVAGKSTLGAFDARMLDLQMIVEASSTRSLQAAGRRLAELL